MATKECNKRMAMGHGHGHGHCPWPLATAMATQGPIMTNDCRFNDQDGPRITARRMSRATLIK